MDVFLSYIISMVTYMVFALPIYIAIRYNRYVTWVVQIWNNPWNRF